MSPVMVLRLAGAVAWFVLCLTASRSGTVRGEDPYQFLTWNVTFGAIYPLGVPQQGILINGQFPGPDIVTVTNENVIVNVFNNLDEPFLLSWNGIQQRRNSFQDGVSGTTCPIPPAGNFTYTLQMKDQIGSFFYFPSLAFHKSAGGFGGIRIASRKLIPVPYLSPDYDFTVLIGDWYRANHTDLRARLDMGKTLPFPDGVLINGLGPNRFFISVDPGKVFRLRVSNVGLHNTLNFQIQDHKMKMIEIEGTHVIQNSYSSIDVHVGQSYSVLVTADQPSKDYYIVVSSRFYRQVINATGTLHYSGSSSPVSGPIPTVPSSLKFSLEQALSFRTNLTASGPRPNPQGSYHYGLVNRTTTLLLYNSAGLINNKQRYSVNTISFKPADTPLKLADYFNISGVFSPNSLPANKSGRPKSIDTSVWTIDYRSFLEIVFVNSERIMQSWHLNGYNFFVVGMGEGAWTSDSRKQYNLQDAVTRCTVQVYPQSWTAIYVSLDNVGIWNLRSEFWARRYLGQQFYLRVFTSSDSLRDEARPPKNVLLCGRAKNLGL